MWTKFKRDIVERFFTFETMKGAYLIPAGGMGLWLTMTAFQHVFQFTFLAGFTYMIVEGCRKLFVNRVKQAIKSEELLQARIDAGNTHVS